MEIYKHLRENVVRMGGKFRRRMTKILASGLYEGCVSGSVMETSSEFKNLMQKIIEIYNGKIIGTT